jgi:hypothetical protein
LEHSQGSQKRPLGVVLHPTERARPWQEQPNAVLVFTSNVDRLAVASIRDIDLVAGARGVVHASGAWSQRKGRGWGASDATSCAVLSPSPSTRTNSLQICRTFLHTLLHTVQLMFDFGF